MAKLYVMELTNRNNRPPLSPLNAMNIISTLCNRYNCTKRKRPHATKKEHAEYIEPAIESKKPATLTSGRLIIILCPISRSSVFL